MKPLPIRIRILTALELAPLSAHGLERALSANLVSIRHWLEDFVSMGVIVRCGVEHGRTGHPWNVYRIAR